MNKIIELLDKKNIKKTSQRINILKIISDNGHISIDSIYEKIKENNPTMSLNTIYKNLDYLSTKNVLKMINTKNNKPMYEIEKEKHFHIIDNNSVTDVIYTEDQIKKIKKILNLKDISTIELNVYNN